MIYHYCRVSTKDQSLDRQIDILNQYKKADQVFCDKQSGKDFNRIQYQELKKLAKIGDEIIIEELDRLGRNKTEMKSELEWFKKQGIMVRVLDVPTTLIDFQGQEWIGDMINNLLIEVLGSIAEQERIKILKRQKEGIEAMRKRGDWTKYGRPKKAPTDFQSFWQKQQKGQITVAEGCKLLEISRSTWYARAKELTTPS